MTGHLHRRRGRAFLALVEAITAGLALTSARSHLTDGAGLVPPASTVITGAQWALWLLAAYIVFLVTITASLVLVGSPRSTLLVLRATPLLLRPAVGALLGVSLAAVPTAAAAASAPTPSATAPSATVGPLTAGPGASAGLAPTAGTPAAGDQPITAGPPQPRTAPRPRAVVGPHAVADPFDWSAPLDAVTALDLASARQPPRARPHQAIGRTVGVRAGDCLWSLAARDLAARHLSAGPAEIGETWPRWYAVNRATVGPDPSLLRPGEVLRVPEPGEPSLTAYSARRPR